MPKSFVGLPTILQGAGAVFGLLAAWNYAASGDDEDLVEAMEATPTSPASDVHPRGYYEVKGKVRAEGTLQAPRARDEVVFYVYRQLEEWEQQDRNQGWVKVSRLLKEETQTLPFWVEDPSGRVAVLPEGARLEGKRLTREVIGASGSSTDRGGGGLGLGGQYRNHRYIHEVYGAMEFGTIYVLGPTDRGDDGAAVFRADSREERPFVISARTEEELAERKKESIGARRLYLAIFLLLSAACFAAAFWLPPMP